MKTVRPSRRVWHLLAVVALSPIALFLLLALLIYLPPVQRFVKDKACESLSAATGLQVGVDHVRLAFPLDLDLRGFSALDGRDSVAVAGSLRLDIELLPLLGGVVSVSEADLRHAVIDSKGFLSDLSVSGRLEHLTIERPTRYDLSRDSVGIHRISLSDGDIAVALGDTAQADTAKGEPLDMVVTVGGIDLRRTCVRLSMPGDSIRLAACLATLNVGGTVLDLTHGAYRIADLKAEADQVDYDIPLADSTAGLDFNHIALTRLSLSAGPVYYCGDDLDATLEHLVFREKSGLELTGLNGRVVMDGRGVRTTGVTLTTPDSRLQVRAEMAWSALKEGGDGQMDVSMDGSVGRKDVCLILGDEASRSLLSCWPDVPLKLNGRVTGNVTNARLHRFSADLSPHMSLTLNGTLEHLLDNDRRSADVNYRMDGRSLEYMAKALPDGLGLPRQLLLGGRLTMHGNQLGTRSTLRSGRGYLTLDAKYNLASEAYEAEAQAHDFDLQAYLPQQPLTPLTARAHVRGRGMDFMQRGTTLAARAGISSLSYGGLPLDSTRIAARLDGPKIEGLLKVANRMLRCDTKLDATMQRDNLDASLSGRIDDLNLAYLGDSLDPTHIMAAVSANAQVGMDNGNIDAHGSIGELNIYTASSGYPADDIDFAFSSHEDSTFAKVTSGDFSLTANADRSASRLADAFGALVDQLMVQAKAGHLDQTALKQLLPELDVRMKAGRRNPISHVLRSQDYDFSDFSLNLFTHHDSGLNGKLNIKDFKRSNMKFEKVIADLKQDSAGLKLNSRIENTSRRSANRFKASVDGSLLNNGFSLQAKFRDQDNKEGLNIGLKGEVDDAGSLTCHIFPQVSNIAYRKFKVNTDNYITLTDGRYVSADVDLLADDHTGLKIVAPKCDSANDISVSLSRINLGELSMVMPYLPRLGGFLSGDLHILQDAQRLTASGTIETDDLKYEDSPLGRLAAELVYLPKDDSTHVVNAIVMADDREVATLNGSYCDSGDGSIDAIVSLIDFPLSLANGFMGNDGTVAFAGNARGDIHVGGTVAAPVVDGELVPDSLHVLSPLYGVDLRVADQPVRIDNSVLRIDGLKMYSKTAEALTVNGRVDFRNLGTMHMNLAFKAKNFPVVNAPRTRQGVLFGKVYADIDATLRDTLNFMVMKGSLNVLGNTNMTYVMKDTPLSVDDRLSGLVEFVDFGDTTTVAVDDNIAPPGGMVLNMKVRINDKAKLHCDLSERGESYFDCRGGGDLTFRYLPNGTMLMQGRFTMGKGEMKYELPFIPLKTFTLEGDNYIMFTGDPMNPTLHITAMEKIRASVSNESEATRMVPFKVGVAITQTLANMGLEMLVEAPEDMAVQSELNAMSKEERGKVAVALLATGAYLTDDNRASFKMNNALSAFLQSEIQNLAGNALRSVDVSVGVEGSTTASGNAQTDYSFQFAKHLWNDRVTFVIGGKVSAGAEDTDNQSFIDNVSLEYRLDQGSTKNIKLFYNHNADDPLEGQYASAGAGFVLRRKVDKLTEVFFNPLRKRNASSDGASDAPKAKKRRQ